MGQDPYPNPKHADGLAFSTFPNVKIPGSLHYIFAEYERDLGFPYPRTGDLSAWASNGILLLNTVWTCAAGKSNSHEYINGKTLWQLLTIEIMQTLGKRKDKLVYILWGKKAQQWKYMLDEKKHTVITGPHPSPWNAIGRDGHPFKDGAYFTRACEALGLDTKIWRLP